MKALKVLALFAFLSTLQTTAFASGNGIERFELPENLSVPSDILAKLNNSLNFYCGHHAEVAHLIQVKNANVTETVIDQGVRDQVIEADLILHIDPSQLQEGIAYDQGEPMMQETVRITWSQFAISNPAFENFELNRLQGANCINKK